MTRQKRRVKLIQPALQLRLVTAFLLTASVASLVEIAVVNSALLDAANRMPADGQLLLAEIPRMMVANATVTFAVLIPLMLLVGVLVTHRIAGPVYRFEQYLEQVIGGEDPGPCRLRERDELHRLAELIDRATLPLRQRRTEQGGAGREVA